VDALTRSPRPLTLAIGTSVASIIVWEDDDTIRELLAGFLLKVGHQVQAFEDPRPALDTVDFSTVDLVITDFDMTTRGDKAIEELNARGIEVPVIVVCAPIVPALVSTLGELGVKMVLKKPFGLAELLEGIKACVGDPTPSRVG
jgi:DNA-binding response OmpR family regulator